MSGGSGATSTTSRDANGAWRLARMALAVISPVATCVSRMATDSVDGVMWAVVPVPPTQP
jgi:hypothetical protein